MEGQGDLFGAFAGGEAKRLRDQGIALVLSNQADAWRERYRNAVEDWIARQPPGRRFIGEDVRHAALIRGVGDPWHPNAWAAMFRNTITKWLKSETVQVVGMAHMKAGRSHGRLSPQYEVKGAN
jgi:hypothetical protein